MAYAKSSQLQMDTESSQSSNYKRKRQRSVYTKLKKLGRDGRCESSKVLDLDQETYEYFMQILKDAGTMSTQSQEEKDAFASNVYSQVEGKEAKFSCHKLGSRVIETIVPLLPDKLLLKLIDALDDIRQLCTDTNGSHVLEALLNAAAQKKANPKLFKFVLKIAKFLLNNLEDFIYISYANCVMRSALHCISQTEKTASPVVTKIEVDPEFEAVLTDFSDRIIAQPQLADFPYDNLCSGLLQALIISLAPIKQGATTLLVKALLKEAYGGADNSKLLDSVSACALLETCIVTAKESVFGKIYEKLLEGKFKEMALNKKSIFIVQKALTKVNKEQFEKTFDELRDSFETLIMHGNNVVLLELANACNRLAFKQGQFANCLRDGLQCKDTEESSNKLMLCILQQKPLGRLEMKTPDTFFINIHGSMIAQTMLKFLKPIHTVNALLAMDTVLLAYVLKSPKGSYLADAYMGSQFVGQKSREKLVKKLKGYYGALASSKHGSRAFDAIWDAVSITMRREIIGEMARKDQQWCTTPTGFIISKKIFLDSYKKNPDEWERCVKQPPKKSAEEIFSDLICKKQDK